ncbi:YlxR family protein [bacterium]|nr:YlxR family protein [bacterium]
MSESTPAAKPSGPVRTCIGCRTRRPDHALVRVAVINGDVVINERGHGRGAWLCHDEQCVVTAGKTKAFSRALRSKLADAVCADTLLGWLDKPPQ